MNNTQDVLRERAIERYEKLRQVVGIENTSPIGLWNIKDMRKSLTPEYLEVMDCVIDMNLRGHAPTRKNVVLARINNKAYVQENILSHLAREYVLLNPVLIQYADILGKWSRQKHYVNSGPSNVQSALKMFHRGGIRQLGKRLDNARTAYKGYPGFYFALGYDEKGPLYRSCFPGFELTFKPIEFPKLAQI